MFEMLIFKKHVKRCNSKRGPPGLRCLGIANKTLNGRDIFSWKKKLIIHSKVALHSQKWKSTKKSKVHIAMSRKTFIITLPWICMILWSWFHAYFKSDYFFRIRSANFLIFFSSSKCMYIHENCSWCKQFLFLWSSFIILS